MTLESSSVFSPPNSFPVKPSLEAEGQGAVFQRQALSAPVRPAAASPAPWLPRWEQNRLGQSPPRQPRPKLWQPTSQSCNKYPLPAELTWGLLIFLSVK